jgi:hypothetical protein
MVQSLSKLATDALGHAWTKYSHYGLVEPYTSRTFFIYPVCFLLYLGSVWGAVEMFL